MFKFKCMIKTEQQCISFSAKGMASRHLFTLGYRIHYTSPTKAFFRVASALQKLLLNGLVPLSLTAPL